LQAAGDSASLDAGAGPHIDNFYAVADFIGRFLKFTIEKRHKTAGGRCFGETLPPAATSCIKECQK